MFLTDEELQQLTGAKQPSKMIDWLKREGQFRVDRNGWPVVLRDHVTQLLGGGVATRQKPQVNVDGLPRRKSSTGPGN